MKTEQGKAIWDKYANSKTDDVYISFQKFNNNFDKTAARTNAQGTSLTNKN